MTTALEAKPKVLIVDDDPSVLQFLSNRCIDMRFEVERASNGLQALIRARHNPPDILIADVNMPELDGLSLCFSLLKPSGKPLQVIVVTSNAEAETLERCESFGATYVSKGPEFWRTVRSALLSFYPKMAVEAQAASSSIYRGHLRQRPMILVVDDDPEVHLFYQSRFRKIGVDLLFAEDGTSGYKIAQKERPNAVLSDYSMPNGDVHYLLQRLRSNQATTTLPLLVMTGRDLDEQEEASLKRDVNGHPGAVGLFKKSFDLGPIVSMLEKYCVLTRSFS